MSGPGAVGRKKLVLVVIDAMVPAMLEQAIALGQAPALARILAEGTYVSECVAPFPSVTPVCAATITTGFGPDGHGIPAMNWFHRDEHRYVEYGSSFTASRRHGVLRSLTDTVYRMNAEHLSREVATVFERLDDVGLRTAGTTYLIYRGRHTHQVSDEGALAKIVGSTVFTKPVQGPRELFYADLYASRRTGCRSQLGMPGIRDQHTGCVGAYLAAHDLYDFLLFSLPDNDAVSHRDGPAAQVGSIAAADRQLQRLMDAAGGTDRFLADNAVIVCSDHAQTEITASIPILDAFAGFVLATPRRLRDSVLGTVRESGLLREGNARATPGDLAVCPSMRSAQVYVLNDERREELIAASVQVLAELDGVDLVMWREGEEAIIAGAGGRLAFAPGTAVADRAGRRWRVEGDLGVLGAEIADGTLLTPDYPDALGRVWSALHCGHAGDVLASAGPGMEFSDWGGQDHIGGGSHGSLHRCDSFATLAFCGLAGRTPAAERPWSLRDITGLVCDHFATQDRPGAD
jgi:hypothetical protein